MKMAKNDDMREEYDAPELGKGARGKYFETYKQGTNVVVLEPDVAKAFPDSQSVNRALRKYLQEHPDDNSEKVSRD